MANQITRYYKESDYMIFFDQATGMFVRYGRNNVDPFHNASGPELLDIAISNYCERECEFCYRRSNRQGKFMPLEDYGLAMAQAKNVGVLQVALGGGNPNQHPQFIEILKMTRDHGIVPSYTTNGQGMTEAVYEATKKYCGAMAVSWYAPYLEAQELIDRAKRYQIKTNIHFLLGQNTVAEAIDLIQNRHDILEKINALVFLNYKPIHSPESLCLRDSEDVKRLFGLLGQLKTCKIGFDSCMISYLPLMGPELALETVEFCEAGRFSAYISEDLMLYPCSFINDISKNGVDLRTRTLGDGWRNGEEFIMAREKLRTPGTQNQPISACKTCESYAFCRGGCQFFNVNRCRD
ncbi:MAG: radical SAM protein [Deltaproteobacteria bacterium]|jgi:radical SAM protein with 4Fe4S-binding SPASM domain|nr:radical SAM protein [Deltaproteobacteria bacterium]